MKIISGNDPNEGSGSEESSSSLLKKLVLVRLEVGKIGNMIIGIH